LSGGPDNETDGDPAFAGIARQAELLGDRKLSSLELIELYLGRIERINPRLNAFTAVFAERAREDAVAADKRLAAGQRAPLLGVPIALKDEVEVQGLIAQHGTRAYSEPARDDAEHWRRLQRAGAILLGKTTLPELAIVGFTETEAWGETVNPWDPARTPGGSSGGSGAAVAAGLVGAASASDGAGSIRIPAACNGIFGLKPQRGRISLAPERKHWLGLSVDGCLTRRVRDSALWLDIAAGAAPSDVDPPPPSAGYREAAAREPGRLRICWTLSAPRTIAPPLSDPAVEATVLRTAEVLGDLGHQVSERDPEWGLVGGDLANRYLKGIEDDYDKVPHPERLEARTRGFKRLARLIPGALIRRTLAHQADHAERINRIFDHCDVLLTPVTATPPVEIGRWAGRGALRTLIGMGRVYPHTLVWNHLGQPAAAIPAGSTDDGLPLGVQMIAPPNREDLLFSLAAQLERELGWPEQRPPGCD
jgi:amidase